MKKQSNYNVGIYCRLSREDSRKSEESNSIANQRAMFIDYANERGWDIVNIYSDDGCTGTHFERPEFKRMIKDVENGKINCILTKDLSRWVETIPKWVITLRNIF